MLDIALAVKARQSCSFCAFQLVTSRSMNSGSACSSAAIVCLRQEDIAAFHLHLNRRDLAGQIELFRAEAA